MKLQVGHTVKLKIPCLENSTGTIGVVVEAYVLGDRYGYMVLFENGNYDGFSEEDEVDEFLEVFGVCEPLSMYKFMNVFQLTRDYQRGYFDAVLKERRVF